MRPSTAKAVRNGLIATVAAVAVGLAAALLAPHDAAQLYRNAVSVVTNSLVIGYVFGVFGPSFGRLGDDISRLVPLLATADRDAALVALDDATPRVVWFTRGLGLAYGLLPNLELLRRVLAGQPAALPYVWVLLLVPVLWAVVFPALWRLYRVSVLVYQVGRRQIRVDVDDLRPLDVFADIGVRHLLLIVIGLAFIPIQAILVGGLDWKDFVPAMAVTLPIALMALLLPVLGVHRAVVSAKRAELDRLTDLLRQADRHSDRHLLLALRQAQVHALSEWPFTPGTAARILFYVIIPPCAWIAAAVVDNWVGTALS